MDRKAQAEPPANFQPVPGGQGQIQEGEALGLAGLGPGRVCGGQACSGGKIGRIAGHKPQGLVGEMALKFPGVGLQDRNPASTVRVAIRAASG